MIAINIIFCWKGRGFEDERCLGIYFNHTVAPIKLWNGNTSLDSRNSPVIWNIAIVINKYIKILYYLHLFLSDVHYVKFELYCTICTPKTLLGCDEEFVNKHHEELVIVFIDWLFSCSTLIFWYSNKEWFTNN